MTSAAWLTLALTWSVVGFFTVRSFLKVLSAGDEEGEGRGRGTSGASESDRGPGGRTRDA